MRLLPHGMKIGHATVIVDIVPKGNPEIRPGIPMKARGITDHDTGNKGRGADAKAHNRLLHNWGNLPVRDTTHISWHGAIDEDYIIQHLPFDEPGFHCGDGWGLDSGNRNTIGFEKCMHEGADRTKIEENAIALYAFLMKEMNFPINWIRPHQYWSGKYCPQLILNKYGSFLPFRNKIEAAYKGGKVPAPKPVDAMAKGFLVINDKGRSVGTLQTDLNKFAGILKRTKLAIDNSFGPATEIYLKAWQRHFGLTADGSYGPASQKKMKTELSNLAAAEAKPKPIEEPKEVVNVPKEIPEWKKEYDRQSKRGKELGFTDGTRPNEPLTREEGGVIAARVYEAVEELLKK